ncbi:MAG: hypothetical protein ACI9R3_006316, partial [Verrucomicrobiales bacterium]
PCAASSVVATFDVVDAQLKAIAPKNSVMACFIEWVT